MNKKKKIIIIIVSAIVGAIALSLAVPFSIYGIRSAAIKTDYKYLKNDSLFNKKVEVKNIELVTQHISCGYATIEMMSSFYGNKISEDDLSKKNNGSISTSTTKGFLNELSDSIPNQSFVKLTYLENDMLLKEICVSLHANNPVALEWAAKYEGEWTLHFSLISALDLENDNITIYNPYGLIENISIDEFISRSTFEAYKNMPGFLSFGFAYGAFDKNAIFFAK